MDASCERAGTTWGAACAFCAELQGNFDILPQEPPPRQISWVPDLRFVFNFEIQTPELVIIVMQNGVDALGALKVNLDDLMNLIISLHNIIVIAILYTVCSLDSCM